MKYLPDTNVFIRAINGFDPEAKFLRKHINSIEISIIVVTEFWANPKPGEIELFADLISRLNVIPIDAEIARKAGVYRNKLIKKSKRSQMIDCFLAAQAKVHHLTLVTNNKADFPMRDIKIITP